MLRIDLDAAGIAYATDDGIADFHSLRHSFISNLVSGGVHPKLAQQLARHSSITLTMDRYSHVGLLDMTAALESLPAVGTSEQQTMRTTGTTDDAPDLSCTKSCNASVQLNRFQPLSTEEPTTNHASEQKRKKPQIPAECEGFEGVKALGLEPRTYGLKVRGKHRENKGFASVVAPMVATDVSDNTCKQLTTPDDVDPELARLIAAWPKLSRNLQRAILALSQE